MQEMRCILGNTVTLEGLVGRFTAFELDNIDNLPFGNIENNLNAKLTIDDSKDKKKKKKKKYAYNGNDTNE